MEQFKPTGFRILPPVVKNLLIINGLFFLATIAFQSAYKIDLTDILGMHYFGSKLFKPYQIVTYMFMHGGFGHIFFNMFAVWMFGNVLENYWGPKRFFIYYMVTGIGAILIQMLVTYLTLFPIQHAIELYIASPSPEVFEQIIMGHFNGYFNPQVMTSFISEFYSNPHNASLISQSTDFLNQLLKFRMDVPTIGASGAVFGVLLAFGMMFPNSLIYIYFAIPIKAKWFVILYGAIELYSGVANNPGDNVAHFAHLGGMLFGFFLIMYWNKKIKNRYF
jgi:membrane associated rhomboid family serine protease